MTGTTKLIAALILATAGFVAPSTSRADTRYDFTITWQQGQLAGTQSSGWLSFDPALASPNGVVVSPNVLTGFELTVRGIHFDSSNITAPVIAFDANGALDLILTGTECFVTGPIPWGTCSVRPGFEDSFSLSINSNASALNAIIGDGPPNGPQAGLSRGTVTSSLAGVVPEPSTLLLLAGGIAIIAARARRAS